MNDGGRDESLRLLLETSVTKLLIKDRMAMLLSSLGNSQIVGEWLADDGVDDAQSERDIACKFKAYMDLRGTSP
jgi:hypothetical protein